jgi:hypothetical protein
LPFLALNLKNIVYRIQSVDLIKGEAVGFYDRLLIVS